MRENLSCIAAAMQDSCLVQASLEVKQSNPKHVGAGPGQALASEPEQPYSKQEGRPACALSSRRKQALTRRGTVQ